MSSIDPKPQHAAQGADYWRSLEEYARTAEFREMVEREFPSVAPDAVDETTRRQFLKVMGASLALAGFTGCRWPEQEILPFSDRPEGMIPGVPQYYATAMELGGVARGLLVKSYDGRPIKIDGNPAHPESQGGSDILSQSAILEMYDPDRSRSALQDEGGTRYRRTWDEFVAAMAPRMRSHRAGQGRGLAVLHAATSSAAFHMLREEWRSALPEARWCEYEPVSRDQEREGARVLFGRPLRPNYDLKAARVIACFDEDVLVSHPASVRYAFDWGEGRSLQDDGEMSRLYAIESFYSPTGGVADHRLAVRPSEIGTVLAELAAELFLARGLVADLDTETREHLRAAREHAKHAPFIRALADDLMAHRGASAVLAGARQPVSSHALALMINHALGNVGATVQLLEDPDPERPSHVQALRELTAAMGRGEVSTLLILGGNPVFDAPADLDFAAALDQVELAAHLSLYLDETSRACTWHLPRAHFLESWDDARAFDGTRSVVQPLIRPLYDGRSPIELLALIGGRPTAKGYDLVREAVRPWITGLDFEGGWRRVLHDGIIPGTTLAAARPSPRSGELGRLFAERSAAHSGDGVDVLFSHHPCVYDGRFANNGWLQELPDALTKLTWDNAALLAPGTAASLGVATDDVLRIEHEGRSIEVPAYIMPGHAPGAVTLHFGYGRRDGGKVGAGVGVDVYPLRTTEHMHYAAGVQVSKTGAQHPLHTTQDHFPIDPKGLAETESRLHNLVREATVAEFRHGNGHHGHHPEPIPLWDEHSYADENKWGMTIDMNVCTGCNACVLACQAENNIPLVGPEGVAVGREMHWIRIDRYFRGDPDDPGVSFQPVTCHHCENAPCEQVCPVAATVHSQEGLNDMIYNRCIGTRYCSNNCPYKVRRFNYFNYNGDMTTVEKMRSNPDVTVRSRGVMEKCTFCIQRIAGARIEAKNERRPIRDGEIVTACQQACPTRAITFGDLNDTGSKVAHKAHDQRSYAMLNAEIYTRPRLLYMKRLRNPASGLAVGEGEDHGSHGGDHHG